MIVLARDVKPTFCGAFLTFLRDKHRSFRFKIERNFQHLFSGRHFHIKRQVGCLPDIGKIYIDDVPAILAKVKCDPLRSRIANHFDCTCRIRVQPAARVADRRNMIDVHAKADAFSHYYLSPLDPGLTASKAASSGGRSLAS